MTDKKTEQQLPPDQQVPPSAASAAEMFEQLKAQYEALMRGQRAKALAAGLRNWGK